MTNVAVIRAILSPAPVYPRTCAVPGYTNLSAGTIQIQPPSGSPALVPPLPLNSGGLGPGVSYLAPLPSGFLTPGFFTITGSFGSPVPLDTSLIAGNPIQIAPVSLSLPLNITWTGGDATSLVRVALTSNGRSVYSYAHATDGSLTISPEGFSPLIDPQVTVSLLPAQPKQLQLPGITWPLRISWQYQYSFGSLTRAP
jgi:hypothetical protein